MSYRPQRNKTVSDVEDIPPIKSTDVEEKSRLSIEKTEKDKIFTITYSNPTVDRTVLRLFTSLILTTETGVMEINWRRFE